MAAVVAAALFALLAPAAPASAVGCYGNSCTGQNPVAMGCGNGAYTLESFWEGFTVELRYSRACNAAWAKATGTTDSLHRAAIYGFTSWSAPYPAVIYATGTPTPDGTYSNMVGFNYWVAACHEYNASGWNTHRCTGRH